MKYIYILKNKKMSCQRKLNPCPNIHPQLMAQSVWPLVLVNDPVAPVILPDAVIAVDGEIPLALSYMLVVCMFLFVVDMFPDEAIVPLVVDM